MYAFREVTIEHLKISGEVEGYNVYLGLFSEAKIEYAEIAYGIEKVQKNLFAYCEGLQVLKLPETVKEIEEDAFSGCVNLTIIAPAGSYAESYAINHGIPVEIE